MGTRLDEDTRLVVRVGGEDLLLLCWNGGVALYELGLHQGHTSMSGDVKGYRQIMCILNLDCINTRRLISSLILYKKKPPA